ncbi:hypothetical protein H4217_004245 [Coemansia sp. RSA 1939]|nr:hypothetical protein H4217_004245 [Coemansia sp. RSA 1939]
MSSEKWQATNNDVDIRIVGISNLNTSLRERTDDIGEEDARRCTDILFDFLSDSQSYMQSLATECLAGCVRVIDIAIAVDIAKRICNHISTHSDKNKPSGMSNALRLIVSRIAAKPDSGASLGQLAIPIAETLKDSSALTSDVVVDIFTALVEVLDHAGAQIADDAEALDKVQSLLLTYISNSNTAISRRAVTVLGIFVVSVPGEQSQKALDVIFQRYTDAASKSDRCTMLRVIVTIARQKPELIRGRVSHIIDSELETVNEADSDLRVASLLAFKTFVANTPDLVRPRLGDIYEAGAKATQFDPDYNYDDEDGDLGEDDEMDTGSEDGLDDEFDDDIYEDNEDVSWDIRLSGVKLLSAIAESELATPEMVVQDIGDLLIKRFKEHEDVVRAEILFTYAKLFGMLAQKLVIAKEETSGMDIDNGIYEMVKQQIPLAVSLLLSSIKAHPKHTETRQLAFVVLARFVPLSIAAVDGILSQILPFVTSTLETSDNAGTSQAATTGIVKANIRIDALDFLLEYAKHAELTAEADDFLFAVMDKLASVTSSNLVMVQAFVYSVSRAIIKLLRSAAKNSEKRIERYLVWLNKITELAINVADTKENALQVAVYPLIGESIQQFGDLLSDAVVDEALKCLTTWNQGVDRAHASMGALLHAITKPTHLPEECVVQNASLIMCQASEKLQSTNAKTQQSALALIASLSKYDTTAIDDLGPSTVARIVDIIGATPESPPLMALRAFAGMCTHVSIGTIEKNSTQLLDSLSLATVYDKLRATAMNELYETVGRLFPGIVESWETALVGKWVKDYVQFNSLRASRAATETAQVQNPINRLPVLAKGIIALRSGYCEQSGVSLPDKLVSNVQGKTPKSPEDMAIVCLDLRSLGYLAAADSSLKESESLYDMIYTYLQSSNSDVRGEAAFALGNYVGAFPGSFAKLFKSAMASIEEEAAVVAASEAAVVEAPGAGTIGVGSVESLQTVKTAIEYTLRDKTSAAASAVIDEGMVKYMWQLISESAQTSTSPMPDILAQCLAIVAARLPQTFIPQLASCVEESRTIHAKAFFITVFRTLLADKSIEGQCDKVIKDVLPAVMSNISNGDVGIRKLSLLALCTVIQNKSRLFDELARTIQPALFAQTVVDESLVKTITMGPFKKRVDDGLETRKCAYQCVHMLVRNMPQLADADAVVDCVVRGVADEQEVRVVMQQIMNESVGSFPTAYKARLDDLVDTISAAQGKKQGKNAVKQEIDRHNDMLRLTVAIVHTLVQFFPKQASDETTKLGEMVGRLSNMTNSMPNASELAAFYREIRAPSGNNSALSRVADDDISMASR